MEPQQTQENTSKVIEHDKHIVSVSNVDFQDQSPADNDKENLATESQIDINSSQGRDQGQQQRKSVISLDKGKEDHSRFAEALKLQAAAQAARLEGLKAYGLKI